MHFDGQIPENLTWRTREILRTASPFWSPPSGLVFDPPEQAMASQRPRCSGFLPLALQFSAVVLPPLQTTSFIQIIYLGSPRSTLSAPHPPALCRRSPTLVRDMGPLQMVLEIKIWYLSFPRPALPPPLFPAALPPPKTTWASRKQPHLLSFDIWAPRDRPFLNLVILLLAIALPTP